jgi:hypothetical protein
MEKYMTEQKNADVVRQAYESFKTGKIEDLLNLLSTDVDWRLPAIPGVPFSGVHRGRDGVGRFFASVGQNQDTLKFEPREFISEGGKVAVLGHYEWRVKSTGREFVSDFAHIFTVRDGKIAGFMEFMDTAAATAAYTKSI